MIPLTRISIVNNSSSTVSFEGFQPVAAGHQAAGLLSLPLATQALMAAQSLPDVLVECVQENQVSISYDPAVVGREGNVGEAVTFDGQIYVRGSASPTDWRATNLEKGGLRSSPIRQVASVPTQVPQYGSLGELVIGPDDGMYWKFGAGDSEWQRVEDSISAIRQVSDPVVTPIPGDLGELVVDPTGTLFRKTGGNDDDWEQISTGGVATVRLLGADPTVTPAAGIVSEIVSGPTRDLFVKTGPNNSDWESLGGSSSYTVIRSVGVDPTSVATTGRVGEVVIGPGNLLYQKSGVLDTNWVQVSPNPAQTTSIIRTLGVDPTTTPTTGSLGELVAGPSGQLYQKTGPADANWVEVQSPTPTTARIRALVGDPTVTPIPGDLGELISSISGILYHKTGPADTNWTRLAPTDAPTYAVLRTAGADPSQGGGFSGTLNELVVGPGTRLYQKTGAGDTQWTEITAAQPSVSLVRTLGADPTVTPAAGTLGELVTVGTELFHKTGPADSNWTQVSPNVEQTYSRIRVVADPTVTPATGALNELVTDSNGRLYRKTGAADTDWSRIADEVPTISLVRSVAVDPSAVATPGDLGELIVGTGGLYRKTGATDTDWTAVANTAVTPSYTVARTSLTAPNQGGGLTGTLNELVIGPGSLLYQKTGAGNTEWTEVTATSSITVARAVGVDPTSVSTPGTLNELLVGAGDTLYRKTGAGDTAWTEVSPTPEQAYSLVRQVAADPTVTPTTGTINELVVDSAGAVFRKTGPADANWTEVANVPTSVSLIRTLGVDPTVTPTAGDLGEVVVGPGNLLYHKTGPADANWTRVAPTDTPTYTVLRSTGTDPSQGGGLSGTLNELVIGPSARLYQKSGGTDTDWTEVTSAQPQDSLIRNLGADPTVTPASGALGELATDGTNLFLKTGPADANWTEVSPNPDQTYSRIRVVAADPTVTPNAGPVNELVVDLSGNLYRKTGATDSDWARIADEIPNISLIRSVGVDPSAVATPGTLNELIAGAGGIYRKTGAGDTAWTPVAHTTVPSTYSVVRSVGVDPSSVATSGTLGELLIGAGNRLYQKTGGTDTDWTEIAEAPSISLIRSVGVDPTSVATTGTLNELLVGAGDLLYRKTGAGDTAWTEVSPTVEQSYSLVRQVAADPTVTPTSGVLNELVVDSAGAVFRKTGPADANWTEVANVPTNVSLVRTLGVDPTVTPTTGTQGELTVGPNNVLYHKFGAADADWSEASPETTPTLSVTRVLGADPTVTPTVGTLNELVAGPTGILYRKFGLANADWSEVAHNPTSVSLVRALGVDPTVTPTVGAQGELAVGPSGTLYHKFGAADADWEEASPETTPTLAVVRTTGTDPSQVGLTGTLNEVVAGPGSLLYRKTGAGDTDWTEIAATVPDISLIRQLGADPTTTPAAGTLNEVVTDPGGGLYRKTGPADANWTEIANAAPSSALVRVLGADPTVTPAAGALNELVADPSNALFLKTGATDSDWAATSSSVSSGAVVRSLTDPTVTPAAGSLNEIVTDPTYGGIYRKTGATDSDWEVIRGCYMRRLFASPIESPAPGIVGELVMGPNGLYSKWGVNDSDWEAIGYPRDIATTVRVVSADPFGGTITGYSPGQIAVYNLTLHSRGANAGDDTDWVVITPDMVHVVDDHPNFGFVAPLNELAVHQGKLYLHGQEVAHRSWNIGRSVNFTLIASTLADPTDTGSVTDNDLLIHRHILYLGASTPSTAWYPIMMLNPDEIGVFYVDPNIGSGLHARVGAQVYNPNTSTVWVKQDSVDPLNWTAV